MTARTIAVRYVLAQTAVRAGVMHLCSERSSRALQPLCGASHIRSTEISTWTSVPEDVSALCPSCAALAAGVPSAAGIGDGLAVFLGTDASAAVRLLELPVDAIIVPAGHPRRTDDDEALAALTATVREHGVLQPVTVRRMADGWELLAGARRLAAAGAAGLPTVPALVRETTDEDAVLAGLVENLHRADLDPIAQARAYRRALEVLGVTAATLARRLHLSREQVANTVRLLGLPDHLQEQVAAGALSAAHGRSLLRVPTGPDQDAFAAQIVAERLTTRDTDEAARRLTSTRPRPPRDPQLDDVARLLGDLLDVQVRVIALGDGNRITIDAPHAELARILRRLGLQAVAA